MSLIAIIRGVLHRPSFGQAAREPLDPTGTERSHRLVDEQLGRQSQHDMQIGAAFKQGLGEQVDAGSEGGGGERPAQFLSQATEFDVVVNNQNSVHSLIVLLHQHQLSCGKELSNQRFTLYKTLLGLTDSLLRALRKTASNS